MNQRISPYDHGILKAKAKDFLMSNHPRMYKEMTKAEVNEYCERKARRAKEYAESLMQAGISEPEAWNRAIRLEILESESD